MKGQYGPCSTPPGMYSFLRRRWANVAKRVHGAPLKSVHERDRSTRAATGNGRWSSQFFWLVVSGAGLSLIHVKVMQ